MKSIKYLSVLFILFFTIQINAQTTKSITVNQPSTAISFSTFKRLNPNENNVTNGQIIIDIDGGTHANDGSYTVQWYSGTTEITSGITNQVINSKYRTTLSSIGAGTYTLKVTDSGYNNADNNNNQGCYKEETYTLTEPPLLEVSILEEEAINCNGERGALKVIAAGGLGDYVYKWYKVAGNTSTLLTSQRDTVATNLEVGFYRVEVTDDDGDGITKSSQPLSGFELKEPDSLALDTNNITISNVSCKGGNDGKIVLNPQGGSGEYRYRWSDLGSIDGPKQRTNLEAGSYFVKILDANDCETDLQTITVTEPSTSIEITYEAQDIQNPTVAEGSDGFINIAIAGGSLNSNDSYDIQWTQDGVNYATSEDLSNLKEGEYKVTVTDSNNCTETLTFTLSDPEVLTVSIVNEQVISCYNEANGTLTANGEGGTKIPTTTGYTYQWFERDGTNFTSINQSSKTVINIGSGVYKVVIKDFYNNEAEAIFTLGQPTEINVNYSKQDVFCKNDETGKIIFSVSGGMPNYSYTLINSNNVEIKNNNNLTLDTQIELENLLADTYILRIKDINNCIKEISISITEPNEQLEVTVENTNDPTAFQVADGAIDISVSGGTPNYSYAWFKVENGNQTNLNITSQNINNIGDGKYIVRVTDLNNCVATSEEIELIQPNELKVDIEIESALLCFGDTNGELLANTIGGIGNYEYEWYIIEGGSEEKLTQTSEIIEDLKAGIYKVKVTDDNNVSTFSLPFTFNSPAQLKIDKTEIVNVACYGESTGSITISVTGGTPNSDGDYNYLWTRSGTNNVVSTNATASNLSQGSYSVVVKDSNNCSVSKETIIITEPTAALSIESSTVSNLVGFETNDGDISVVIGGGTPDYTYQWTFIEDNEVLSFNTSTISNLKAGNYKLVLTDANNCTLTENFEVTQPDKLEVEIVQTSFNGCFGDSTAVLKAEVSGGTSPYQYNWYNTNNPGVSLGDTSILEGLSSGTYGVRITDNNSIIVTDQKIVAHPPKLEISGINKTDVLCYGANTGSIELTVVGGTGTYSYSWSNGSTSESISNLFAGEYTVTVTDEKACTVKETIIITEPTAALSIESSTVSNLAGFETNDGDISVVTVGGTPDYTYQWTFIEDNEVLSFNTSTISNLKAGNYKLVLTDANNCTLTENFEVTQPDKLEVEIVQTSFNGCFGDSTAVLKAEVTGGTSPYQYNWYNTNNPDVSLGDTSTLEGLSSGTYGVKITDNNSIIATDQKIVAHPPKLEISGINKTDVLCYGANTGSIVLTVVGGTGTYSYSWSNGSTSESISNLFAGEYTVTVTDEKACTVKETIIITEPTAALSIESSTVSNLAGFETNDGDISVVTVGGTPDYTYQWTFIEDNEVLSFNTSTISNLKAGNYKLVLTDANNCTLTENFEVTQPDKLEVEIVQTSFNGCFGDSTAVLKAEVTGGTSPYQYNWYNTNNPDVSLGDTSILEGLSSGTYGVKITDNNSIIATDQKIVAHPPKLEISGINKTDVLCYGANTGSIVLTVVGGTGTYSYSWSNGSTSESISNLFAGEYTVTVTDEKACFVESSTITITEPPLFDVTSVSLVRPSGNNSDGSISIEITGGKAPYSYVWVNNETGNQVQEANNQTDSVSAISNLPSGTYTISIIDNLGCIHQETYNLGNPGELITEIAQVENITCFANNNGTLKVNVIGGVGGNEFAWYDAITNIKIGVNSEYLRDVKAGSYYVVVVNAEGIQEKSDTFEVTQPLRVDVASSSNNLSCFEANDGEIFLDASGGSGVYEYRIQEGNNLYSNWVSFSASTTSLIDSLKSGIYNVQVRDSNACNYELDGVVQTIEIEITQPDLLEITNSTVTQVSGFGLSNGSIVLDIEGGTLPYTISWVNENNETQSSTSSSLNNIPKGIYTVNVRDAQECSLTETFEISEPDLLTVAITQQNFIQCNADSSGSLRAGVTGGVLPYTYQWYKEGAPNVIESLVSVSGLEAGNYYVVITDDNNNKVQSDTFEVTQPLRVDVASSSKNLSCFEANDGEIFLDASGGSGVYEYRIREGNNLYSNWVSFSATTTSLIDSLKSGIYNVQVRDSNACNFELDGVVQTIEIEITQPDLLEITNSTVTQVSGFGLSNGSIVLDIEGGTLPYTISWVNENNETQSSTSSSLNNIPKGIYTVNVRDAQECSLTETFEISEPDLLTVAITQQNFIQCNADSSGSLRASVTGGVLPYTYQWYKEGAPNVIESLVSVSGLEAGNYYVVITDDNNNKVQSDTFEVTQPDVLEGSINAISSSCGTGNDWTINAEIIGGTLPYIYNWNTGDNTASITNKPPGNYLLIVKDANGCELRKNYSIEAPEELNLEATITQINCSDACVGAIDLTITNGQAPYEILWNTGATSKTLNNLCPGNYSVSIIDQKGCELNREFVIENPDPIIVNLGEDVTLCTGQTHELDISVDDTNATYSWQSSNGFSSSNSNVVLDEAGIYTATVTTSLGCIGTDTIEIKQSNVGINAQFLITSQAFAEEEVVLINTSNPISEDVIWIIPNEVEIIEETRETILLRFDTPGVYEITLRSIQGDCFLDYTKPIIVEEARDLPDIGDSESPFIVDFNVYPNPSNGAFQTQIVLKEAANISVRMFSMTSNSPIDDRLYDSKSEYILDYDINLPSGLYILLLETPNGNEFRKIIVE